MDLLDERCELKFLVEARQLDNILEAVRANSNLDPRCIEEGSYQVSTTYLDTPDMDFFYAAEEGRPFRRRVRLRSYGGNSETINSFIEIKERRGRESIKRREPIKYDLEHSADLPLISKILAQLPDGEIARELAYLLKHFGLEPVLSVNYLRSAWYDRTTADVRITIDREISTRPLSLGGSPQSGPIWLVDSEVVLFEIKAIRELPLWLLSTFDNCKLSAVKFSKYNKAFQKLGLHGTREDRASLFTFEG